MHDEAVGAGHDHRARQRVERDFGILVVDADPAFHGDGHAHRGLHRRDALRYQLRLRHQAGAEAAVLHAIRGAADIDVDLVIAKIFADLSGFREMRRIGTAELQRHRMLAGVIAEQPLPVAMNDRACRQHLRIEQRPPRHQPVKHPAMAIGPVHHRGDGEFRISDQ